MKTLLIIVGVIAALAVPLSVLMFYGMSDIRKLIVHDLDLSKLADGTYSGSFHKGRWTYDVEVHIQGHKLTAVKNVNPRMQAVEAFNTKIEQAMLERQNIGVDVVAGATINTLAFKKAVELALKDPPQRLTPNPAPTQGGRI
jgi:uncharacterized protein with FMN-binding domain